MKIYKKTLFLIIFIIISVFFIVTNPITLSPLTRFHPLYKKYVYQKTGTRNNLNKGKLEKINNKTSQLRVIYVKGTPYEMGYQHGSILRKQTKSNVNKTLTNLYHIITDKKSPNVLDRLIINSILDQSYKKVSQYIPNDYKEEMRGLSIGSGISLKKIHRIHMIPDLTEKSCSSIVALNKATKNGKLYHVRILDYIMDFGIQQHPLLTVYMPNKGNIYTSIGWAGFVGSISGMNAEGISIGEIGYGKYGDKLAGIPAPQPKESIHGTPMVFLLKKILQYADNIENASGIIKSTTRTNYYMYMIADGITKENEIRAKGYITTRDYIKEYDINKGFPLKKIDNIIYASAYNNKCHSLLKKYYGEITPELLIKKVNPHIAMSTNLHTVIYDPTNLLCWIANAENKERAVEQEYFFFNLKEVIQ